MPKEDILVQSALQNAGQNNFSSGMGGSRGIYPAIVVPFGTNDITEQNRIRARIVSVGDDGKIIGKTSSKNEENYNQYSGKDRGILDEQLVLCIPLIPQFIHVKPQVGEMVFVIIENPLDSASVRYWVGPIITSKLKLKYQAYEDSVRIFDKEERIPNMQINNKFDIAGVFPEDSDIALQGRDNADLILKSRESLLISGKLNEDNFTLNYLTPSFLRLKQISSKNIETKTILPIPITHEINISIILDTYNKFVGTIIVKELRTNFELKRESNSYESRDVTVNWLNTKINESKIKYKGWKFVSTEKEFKNFAADCNVKPIPSVTTPPLTNNEEILKKYSQGTLVSTNINIYSPRGKFRGDDIKSFEKNTDLKSFGEIADSLHPLLFGDEAVRLFDLIIRLLLEHIHTPQMPLLQTAISDELKKYTVDGKLQNLISNHIRIN